MRTVALDHPEVPGLDFCRDSVGEAAHNVQTLFFERQCGSAWGVMALISSAADFFHVVSVFREGAGEMSLTALRTLVLFS